jgi:YHS domain-containing protein
MRLLPILLFVAIAIMLLLPVLRRMRLPARSAPRSLPDELVKDPVCQTYIVKSRAVRRTDAGQVRYFCSEQCARLHTGG